MNQKQQELKVWPEYFRALVAGTKNFEVRKNDNDRDFQVGDLLILREWDSDKGEYTGAKLMRTVHYIFDGGAFGVEAGYCILGWKVDSDTRFADGLKQQITKLERRVEEWENLLKIQDDTIKKILLAREIERETVKALSIVMEILKERM